MQKLTTASNPLDGKLTELTGTNTKGNVQEALSFSPSAPVSTVIGDTLYGINHRLTPGAVPLNRDFHGYTFFTRPDLNLTRENLNQCRQLTHLLTKDLKSFPAYIRTMLSPRLHKLEPGNASSIVDHEQAFIPLLSNHLISQSGWPDLDTPLSTLAEGTRKETMQWVDGIDNRYQQYNLTCNFRNMVGSPVLIMLRAIQIYSQAVFLGEMVPFPDNLYNNVIDYCQAIWRISTDSTKRVVTGIARTGPAITHSSPYGSRYNWEIENPINSSNNELSFTFSCVGVDYDDPILVTEFNMASTYDAPWLMDDVKRAQSYIKIPFELIDLFNYKGTPMIDPYTMELNWWVRKQTFENMVPFLNVALEVRRTGAPLSQQQQNEFAKQAYSPLLKAIMDAQPKS